MPGDVSRVQSPESDEGMMQANVQNRRRTRLLFQCEQSAFFGREQWGQRQRLYRMDLVVRVRAIQVLVPASVGPVDLFCLAAFLERL